MLALAALLVSVFVTKIDTDNCVNLEIKESYLDIIEGSETAPVQVFMFMDYTCGHCKRFLVETYPQIKSQYINSDRVRFNMKLISFSNNANIKEAYKMAICLNQQGNFKNIHELLLYETSAIFSEEFLIVSDEFVNNSEIFAECMYGEKVETYLQWNLQSFVANQFSGTPTFVINNKFYKGFKNFKDFSKIIEGELRNL